LSFKLGPSILEHKLFLGKVKVKDKGVGVAVGFQNLSCDSQRRVR
jgi:hypothetical protein